MLKRKVPESSYDGFDVDRSNWTGTSRHPKLAAKLGSTLLGRSD